MLKRTLMMLVVVGGFVAADAADANAWVVRRVAPVRRVAARAALPPYPVARRVAVGPVYRRPVVYGAVPVYVAPRVHVGIGYGYGYGY